MHFLRTYQIVCPIVTTQTCLPKHQTCVTSIKLVTNIKRPHCDLPEEQQILKLNARIADLSHGQRIQCYSKGAGVPLRRERARPCVRCASRERLRFSALVVARVSLYSVHDRRGPDGIEHIMVAISESRSIRDASMERTEKQ